MLKQRNLTASFLLSLLLSFAACEKATEEYVAPARPAKLLTVKSKTGATSRSFPAEIKAAKRGEIAFVVGGKIIKLYVKEGQEVKKGDTLAQLDQHDFKAKLAAAKSQYEKANITYLRLKKLLKQEVVSQQDVDDELMKVETAISKLKTVFKAYRDTTMVAPFSGRVAKTYFKNFEEVRPKQPVLSLQNILGLDLIFEIPEKSIVDTMKGEYQLFASFDAMPGKKFELVVKEFSTEASKSTQSYKITCTMDSPKDEKIKILPGMTAEVMLLIKDKGKLEVFEVPESALATDKDGKWYVWIATGDKELSVSKRTVEVGEFSENNVIVTKGLKNGELVVASGGRFLSEGAKVTPYGKQSEDNK